MVLYENTEDDTSDGRNEALQNKNEGSIKIKAQSLETYERTTCG